MTENTEGSLTTRFASIVEHCEDAIISLALDGTVTSWNQGATKLFGYDAETMVGVSITKIIPEERHAEEDAILSNIRQGQNVSHFETKRLAKDGRALDISLTVSPIKDENGTIVGASKIARDISARKGYEAARQKLIECARLVGRPFLDAVVEALAEALQVRWVLLCDLHPQNPKRARVISAWSDGRAQEYFEYDLQGTPCANVLGDDICFYPRDVADLFPDDPLLGEMGAESYLGVPLRSADGGNLGLLAVLNDKPINEELLPRETLELFAGRAAAEMQRLVTASTNERLGRIVEDAANETYVFDTETLKFILVNRGARENLGYAMEEMRALTPLDIKPLMTAESFERLLWPLRTGEKSVQQFETVHRRKDGSEYNVLVSIQLLQDDDRPVFFAATEDTTARDVAVRALKEVSQRLDTILDNTTMSVFLMDDRQECVYMNPAAERLTGYAFEETRGRPLHDVIHHTYPDGRPFPLHECAIDRAFPEENQVQGEETFIHKDGTFYPVAFTASPIRDDTGKAVGTVIEVREITEEIKAREAMTNFNAALKMRVEEAVAERSVIEEQLRQSQKLEALGKLTGGVAHDFNNLLQVISGNLQLLMRDVADHPRAQQRVQNAMAGVDRGARLASHLLAFGRKQPLTPKPVNLGGLVSGMDDLLQRALGEGIEVVTEIAENLWNSLADESQVENALLNLAINARDAMQGHGKLTIKVSNAYLDKRYARQHSDVKPGEYVKIEMSDTGCGISSDILDQVFEPFFTTKPPGEGSGLGLSMVYGLTKQSGGHISLDSEVGQGATFCIYLPRTTQAEEVKTPASTGPVCGGAETILVVEDDEEVRATVVEMLSELGYRVLHARDAASGLAIVESGAPIDLLFTDFVMPGPLRSQELARRAQDRIPGLAVLFTSGYMEGAIAENGRDDAEIDLLRKPYTRDELAQRLRAHLDRKQSTPQATLAASPTPLNGAGLKILLVEDEPLIRMTGSDMLADLGHTVFEAGTAPEALRTLDSEKIDVLITDLGLPGMSGACLVSKVRDRWPSMRIVIASGYGGPDEYGGEDLGSDVAWLAKPYQSEDFRRVLEPENAQ
ncbi:PAS domain S-box protein [Pseudohoeflea coraliihabitans]|uniref:histidine kinase n=1 Tax=Pseudohoeflea coraliihabitans TaxID=2860393 RepID=A0ABS6WQV8_9HYPH|nr:PAS domain S-box protein [Pseudohoeflea sp. DP4N28-3]MBW3098338.1 PAS domain S-box protein [Pseudohoeflea sp. DP4N28-3]